MSGIFDRTPALITNAAFRKWLADAGGDVTERHLNEACDRQRGTGNDGDPGRIHFRHEEATRSAGRMEVLATFLQALDDRAEAERSSWRGHRR